MTAACIGTTIQWSAGVFPDNLLNAQMHYAMGLVALGVLRGTAQKKLQAKLQAVQQQIHSATTHKTHKTLPENDTIGAS